MFIPVISIFIPFMTSLGVSMTNFFLLQSFFGVCTVVMEVPSGYLADMVGRKKTISAGAFLSGIAFTLLFYSTKLSHLYAYEFLIASSLSLTSGADYALLFDSLKEHMGEIDRKIQAKWTSHFMAASFMGEAVSAVIGGLLSAVSMSHVLIVTAAFGWLPFVASLFMREPKVKKMEGSHKENFQLVMRHLFLDSKFLRALFFNFIVWSLSTMCVVWLIQKYWEENGLPLIYFGFLWAGYSVVGAVFNHFSHPIENKLGSKVTLFGCALLVSFTCLLIPQVDFVVGVGLMAIFYIARGVFQPVFKEGFNHRLEEEFRATANSITSLGFRLSFAVVGPLLGLYVDSQGVTGLFTILGVVFLALAILFLLPFLRMEEE